MGQTTRESESVHVRLKPEQSRFVNDQISVGHFSTSADVIDAALGLLQDQEAWIERNRAEVIGALGVGIAQLDCGESAPWDSAAIRAKGRQAASIPEAPGDE